MRLNTGVRDNFGVACRPWSDLVQEVQNFFSIGHYLHSNSTDEDMFSMKILFITSEGLKK